MYMRQQMNRVTQYLKMMGGSSHYEKRYYSSKSSTLGVYDLEHVLCGVSLDYCMWCNVADVAVRGDPTATYRLIESDGSRKIWQLMTSWHQHG